MKPEALRIGVLCEEDGAAYVYSTEMAHRFFPGGVLSSAGLLGLMEAQRLDQLWIHDSWPHSGTAFWDVAQSAGWRQGDTSRPDWLLWWRPGVYGLREIAIPAQVDGSPWQETHSGRELLAALSLYEQHVGLPFRRSPGGTGIRLMRKVHEHGTSKKVQLEPLQHVPEPATHGGTERDFAWCAQLEKRDLAHQWLYAWDKNAMFLGACSSLELGLGEPEYVAEAPAFDPRLPGYWQVETEPWLLDVLPDPLRPDVATASRGEPLVWLCSPTVALARELGMVRAIHAAYIFPRHSRLLSAWYAVVRDARLALTEQARAGGPDAGAAQVALGAVKATYAQAIGWLPQFASTADGETLHRPDWRHAVIAQARANFFRQLVHVTTFGHRLFAVSTDCAYFLSDLEDAEAARPSEYRLGDGLGCYKLHDAVRVADVHDELEALREPDARHRLRNFRALQSALGRARRQGA